MICCVVFDVVFLSVGLCRGLIFVCFSPGVMLFVCACFCDVAFFDFFWGVGGCLLLCSFMLWLF